MKIANLLSWIFKKKEKKGEVNLNEGNKELFTKKDVKNIVKQEVEKSKEKESLRNHIKKLVKEEVGKSKKEKKN